MPALRLPLPLVDRPFATGLTLVAAMAWGAQAIAQLPSLARLGISPLIVGVILGVVYGNTLRHRQPTHGLPGILFASKTLLRAAVVFYGFRITFQDIAAVGGEGITVGLTMLATTFLLGAGLGIKAFRLTPRLALMIAAGSAVCGAAAVLATEPVVRGRPHESSIAVGTVVIFGTLAMFLYPLAYQTGLMGLDAATYGLFAGSSLHEVAHVVAAGRAVSAEAANNAVIVKMLRVMMLAPLLALLGAVLARRQGGEPGAARARFPWFAIGFIICVGVHSLAVVPAAAVAVINDLDLFALTMAMCALGLETRLDKVRSVGARPFVLAACLALWLAVGGYWVSVLAHRVLGAG